MKPLVSARANTMRAKDLNGYKFVGSNELLDVLEDTEFGRICPPYHTTYLKERIGLAMGED